MEPPFGFEAVHRDTTTLELGNDRRLLGAVREAALDEGSIFIPRGSESVAGEDLPDVPVREHP